uniref:adenine phosphoribosyltransferase n=1 Tax=Geotrypetes seraphini TaxID=260995 RepID=A0A6P8P4X9_GEOSA|nr:adenine phosphoribosyltransferase-like isoform X2 [Geotrypetes seraphini]
MEDHQQGSERKTGIFICENSAVNLMPGYNTPAAHMDLWSVPHTREKGWYLSLMAPNDKGPNYAWLDPSRLYCHQQALQDCIEDLLQPFRDDFIDLVAGIDAMGFILGAAIANYLGKGFLAIRKSGHLCVKTHSQPYVDYSGREKVMEVRTDAIKPGLRILLVDQWIETGGTMQAAIKLVEQEGGVVAGVAAICIEDSEGGLQVKAQYKCSDCVPEHLRIQFNSHYLHSFEAFPSQQENHEE